ncbi:Flp family type IVb pilin [Tabrizicola caldifontis]|uniref:Flp family type IVb pilin n=1 Tax=Tabrizicola caldifontis TaxID=2528036 RepID=UPI001980A11D|nr:Flp family type IVb pilin [Rhodobacter sp. YIM 73028]
MTNFLKKTFARLIKDEKGVTLVEYGIALLVAVGVGTAVMGALSTSVQTKVNQATSALGGNPPTTN